MSCEMFKTEIDGHKYAYTQLSATASLKLKYKLAGIIGSAIGDLTTALGKTDVEQMKSFSQAVEHIFAKNDPDEMVDLIKKILAPAFRDDTRIEFDAVYTGNTTEMYKALFWVLKQEYGGFMEGLESLA